MSDLIERLLEEEFRRLESESGRIARTLRSQIERLIELDEAKLKLLEELRRLVEQKKQIKLDEIKTLEADLEQQP